MRIPEEKAWLAEVMSDMTSVIEEDPDALKRRNERFGSYLVYMSTLIMKNRFKARQAKNSYDKNNPRPDKGIKTWEEGRDAETAESRYWVEYLERLRSDIQTRISLSQTNLNHFRQELSTFGSENAHG